MSPVNTPQPDVKLMLDERGVIREASVSRSLSAENLESWVGRPWSETVADAGRDKIASMLTDARQGGVSGFRELNQRFPSGLEIPMEFTTVWLGGPVASAVAIGRNLATVAELQSRLISAQQALERDYWKLRDVETRYRQLFEASNEAVILMRADDQYIVEANPAALRALGLPPQRPERVPGSKLLRDIQPEERASFQAMLVRARDQGKAPGVVVHLGAQRHAWMVRASLIRSDGRPVFLLQLSPAMGTPTAEPASKRYCVDELVLRAPDALVVLDREGVIQQANPAFLDMVQLGAEAEVLGERLDRWLAGPMTTLGVLFANLRRLGMVRMFPTRLRGELGSEIDVELSAVGDSDEDPDYVGMLLRDVSRRPTAGESGLGNTLRSMDGQLGKTSLRKLVRETVAMVEKHAIRRALEATGGNRTAAAELLGLSRQSLYAKLGRYGMDTDTAVEPVPPI
jgi:transcriptional regulator PpsR